MGFKGGIVESVGMVAARSLTTSVGWDEEPRATDDPLADALALPEPPAPVSGQFSITF